MATTADIDTPSRTDEKLGLYVELDARQDKIDEVAAFLKSAESLVRSETGTLGWYALRIGDSRFAIFDTFANESDREVHLGGQVAKMLMQKAPDLLTHAPQIHKCEVLASK
ncbi:putative quinol monooxygenase [Asticcacaulis solisilvae]|uniref:putative quinol monooxygenase n=1 Tax=Asticcacaulis solisilvae TaxID=1217274 RepID=UPI003FD8FA73